MGPNPSPTDPAIDEDALLEAARAVLGRAYSPYSSVCVGAALLDEAGGIHVGCNVENASYGLTVCAERNAVSRALAEGASRFVAIAIATDREERLPPCGACRQVLAEFAPDLYVVSTGRAGGRSSWRLSELMPEAFRREDLA